MWERGGAVEGERWERSGVGVGVWGRGGGSRLIQHRKVYFTKREWGFAEVRECRV